MTLWAALRGRLGEVGRLSTAIRKTVDKLDLKKRVVNFVKENWSDLLDVLPREQWNGIFRWVKERLRGAPVQQPPEEEPDAPDAVDGSRSPWLLAGGAALILGGGWAVISGQEPQSPPPLLGLRDLAQGQADGVGYVLLRSGAATATIPDLQPDYAAPVRRRMIIGGGVLIMFLGSGCVLLFLIGN